MSSRRVRRESWTGEGKTRKSGGPDLLGKWGGKCGIDSKVAVVSVPSFPRPPTTEAGVVLCLSLSLSLSPPRS